MQTNEKNVWTADTLAEHLKGEWIVAPTEPDWYAAYFAVHGVQSGQSKEQPVSVIEGIPRQLSVRSKAFIISKKNKEDFLKNFSSDTRPVICVEDVDDTLFTLAKVGRAAFTGKLISITESDDKLSIKDMVSELLKRVGTVQHTFRNRSDRDGIRSALASCITKPDYAVVEASSQFLAGQGTRTRRLISPDISIITQTAMASADELELHTDGEKAVALIKAKIFEFMRPDGIAIMSREMAHYDLVREYAVEQGVTPVSYGLSFSIGKGDADAWILDIQENNDEDGSIVRVNIYGEKVSFRMPFYGVSMALNSLAALTCIYHLGLNVKEAAEHIENLSGGGYHPNLTKVDFECGGTATIIDDFSEAQPPSFLDAISALKSKNVKSEGRKIAVLGDIEAYKDPRYAIGYFSFVMPLQKANFDKVYFVGQDIRRLAEVLPTKKIGGVFDTPEAAAETIAADIRPHDIILVKVPGTDVTRQTMAMVR